jgi:3-oxoacyl-[acyl-carrier protein] reductase
MRTSLGGRVALVTGAARGIGAAIAQRFAAEGCQVVVGDINAEGARACAAGLGAASTGLYLDVADRKSVEGAVSETVRRYGGVDILLNNAGVLSAGPFDKVSEAEWSTLVGVNVGGLFHCVQAAVPAMEGRRHAAIINIASISAERGGGVFGNLWYAATKAAVVAITKGLGRELGPRGIRANAIAPGVIDTEMVHRLLGPELREAVLKRVPLGRLISGEDIAACAVFLASEDASGITGETVTIDGGFLRA